MKSDDRDILIVDDEIPNLQLFFKRFRQVRLLLLIAAIFLLGLTGSLNTIASEKTLTIGATVLPGFTSPDGSGRTDKIFKKVSARSGVKIKIVHMPGARAKQEANNGTLDGYLTATKLLTVKFKNLMIVPVAHSYGTFHAVSKAKIEGVSNWGSLKKYRVGYLRGHRYLENNFPSRENNVELAETYEQLVDMLVYDRIDMFLGSNIIIDGLAKKHELMSPMIVSKPIDKIYWFLAINKKNANLSGAIEKALLDIMDKSGESLQN